MPALIHNSPAFTSAGIALLSQSITEAPTGLVRVAIEYSLTDAYTSRLPQLFYLDAPPPLLAPAAERLELQGSQGARLFMETYAAQKSFGQWTVRATYVGARSLRSRFRGFITRDTESRVTPPFSWIAGIKVSVRFHAQVIKTTIAGIDAGAFDLENEDGSRASVDALISRLRFASVSLPGFDPSSGTSNNGTLFGLSPRFVFNAFDPVIQDSTSINNVTNRVILATTTREVVFRNPGGPQFPVPA
jgi:hypothetical protein